MIKLAGVLFCLLLLWMTKSLFLSSLFQTLFQIWKIHHKKKQQSRPSNRMEPVAVSHSWWSQQCSAIQAPSDRIMAVSNSEEVIKEMIAAIEEVNRIRDMEEVNRIRDMVDITIFLPDIIIILIPLTWQPHSQFPSWLWRSFLPLTLMWLRLVSTWALLWSTTDSNWTTLVLVTCAEASAWSHNRGGLVQIRYHSVQVLWHSLPGLRPRMRPGWCSLLPWSSWS